MRCQKNGHTVDDISDGLESSTTNGPLVNIKFSCLAVQPEQENIAANVEYRVDSSGQKG